ncbi:hypothetical protein BVRB_6g137890 [Beta vulgaris subsp. vulgaris]|nr:hypothetical protein BVRB_6g137890 [Beta vulgaris subsp. vulgaris]
MTLHKALLLSTKAAMEEAFERRFLRCSKEECIAKHKVGRSNIEANGLHYIPRKFPECEPHKGRGLDHHVAQPSPQLPAN